MNKAELARVYERAKRGPVEGNAIEELEGLAYWKERRPVTLEGAAAMLRWQALCLDGSWDYEALSECLGALGKKALLID